MKKKLSFKKMKIAKINNLNSIVGGGSLAACSEVASCITYTDPAPPPPNITYGPDAAPCISKGDK